MITALLGLYKDFGDRLSLPEPNTQLGKGTAGGRADINQEQGHGVWKSHSGTKVGDLGLASMSN